MAIAKAQNPQLQKFIAGRLLGIYGEKLDDDSWKPKRLPGEVIGSVAAIVEMRGHELDHEADHYGSDLWALRILAEYWTRYWVPDFW